MAVCNSVELHFDFDKLTSNFMRQKLAKLIINHKPLEKFSKQFPKMPNLRCIEFLSHKLIRAIHSNVEYKFITTYIYYKPFNTISMSTFNTQPEINNARVNPEATTDILPIDLHKQ